MEVKIQPLIMAEWVHRGTGVKYDTRYFNHPEYRATQDLIIRDWLHVNFPKYFTLDNKMKAEFNIGIGQVYIIICSLFGAEIRYFDNYNPDVASLPLRDVEDLQEVQVPEIENSRLISLYLEQYNDLATKYGKHSVSLLGFVNKIDYPNYGTFVEAWSHSPLTIAYKLRGDQIFIDMIDSSDSVKHLLEVIVMTIEKLWKLLAKIEEVGEINLTYIPCCTSSVVGPRVFGQWDIPIMKKLMSKYSDKGGVHSCGPSTKVLDELAKLSELVVLELGEGTDMVAARKLWPKAELRYILDTYKMLNDSKEAVKQKVVKAIEDAGCGLLTIQLSVEWGTPAEMLDVVYETVLEHNKKEHGIEVVNMRIANMGIHTR